MTVIGPEQVSLWTTFVMGSPGGNVLWESPLQHFFCGFANSPVQEDEHSKAGRCHCVLSPHVLVLGEWLVQKLVAVSIYLLYMAVKGTSRTTNICSWFPMVPSLLVCNNTDLQVCHLHWTKSSPRRLVVSPIRYTTIVNICEALCDRLCAK